MQKDSEHNNTDSGEQHSEDVPKGIERIRKEWTDAGLVSDDNRQIENDLSGQVVFDETEDGGADIGDYTLEENDVQDKLALSSDAIKRLSNMGEIDSILVRSTEGHLRRLYSESSVARFQKDSEIDPKVITRAAERMADLSAARSIEELASEVEELRNTQGKILQQMKDILLLEVRNLKEQERDLSSFVYELAEEVRKSSDGKKK